MNRWLIWVNLFLSVYGWSNEELALYDLVEEIGENFYQFFQIQSDSSLIQIKKSYRKLSLEWHPDRNQAENASEKFRQIVAVYEVLKSDELRGKYDDILVNGLPSWRSGIYYYRRVRKMGLGEAMLILIPLIIAVHYLMLWGAYFERYLVETQRKVKVKRERDRLAVIEDEQKRIEIALEEYKPRWSKMLPCMVWRGLMDMLRSLHQLSKRPPQEIEEVVKPMRNPNPSTPIPVYEFEVARDVKAVANLDEMARQKYENDERQREAKYSKNSIWTCEELMSLVKLSTEKYPPGTPNRWELMASALQRSTDDVISMAGKLKNIKQEEYNKLLSGQTSSAVKDSSKTPIIQPSTDWSQEEQKLFERALIKFPKGVDNRWDEISREMGSRSKTECLDRFKQLAEIVRLRKVNLSKN